jgi:DNA-binding CsgD family transcriptional regulator/tetratricopeptide (TPR) repeat protein
VVERIERGAMVGRDGELALLESALAAAVAGRGRTVVISGEAGIGKTRLVSAIVDAARSRGLLTLAGDCLPTAAGAIPYAPFVEALRTLIRATEPGAVAGLLGPSRLEVGRLLPEVASTASPARDGPDDRGGQGRLFEGLLSLLVRQAARDPLVLVIEDVQWADVATRSLVTFLSRGLRSEPVLLLVTVRTEDLGDSDVMRWLGELERDAWIERIELTPLQRRDVAAMLRSIRGSSPPSGAVDAVAERSGGNPFFIEQLAAASDTDADRDLGPRLRDVLVARLAELPDATRTVLRAAAAAGRLIDDDVLGSVLGLSPSAIADALRPAIAQGILVERSDGRLRPGYAFRHALIAEVAEGELIHGERDRLHAAFAGELERRAATDDLPVQPAELAFHWVAAHDPKRALPALVVAGLAAEHVYAFAEAQRQFEQAIGMWPPGESTVPTLSLDRVALLQHAADSAVLAGSYADALAHGRQAIVAADIEAVASGQPDRARLGALHERLRWYLWEAGDRVAAEAAVAEALRLIPIEPPSALRARALAQAAGLRLFGGSPAEAGELARQAMAIARRVDGAAEEALALGVLGWSTAVIGDVDEGIATYRQGLDIAERLGGVEGIALGHANLAALLDRVGRSQASLDAALAGFAITQRLGVARTYGGGLLGHAAKALFDLGRWDEATRVADEGLALDPVGASAMVLRVSRARVATDRGRFDEAREHLDVAAAIDGGRSRHHWSVVAATAELDAWQGRLEPIRAAVESALDTAGDEALDPHLGWLAWHATRAEADAATAARARHADASVDEIQARLEPLEARIRQQSADRPGGPIDARRRAVAELCLGELARLHGQPDVARWERTAKAWEAIGRPMLIAYALFRVAEARLGQRGVPTERASAAADLRASHAIARSLGARPLLEEIERLGRHARIELSSQDETGSEDPLGLTDRETEVIRLVAAGRSNQQIADTLFITRKTASVHVSNILGKLGVANRVEAAAIAQRLGLDDDPPDTDRSGVAVPYTRGHDPEADPRRRYGDR